jgi:ATPases involved in chromosome partitioning
MAKLDFQAIKNKRVDMDITQKQLSLITNININTLKAIETGRSSTDEENIKLICACLNLDFNNIYNPNFKDTKIISVINNKGGCGKTSVCSSLGYVLADMGYKVLLIDSDSQRNLTSSYDIKKGLPHFGEAVSDEKDLSDFIIKTRYPNIDFIPADVSMGTLDMLLFTKLQRENVVKQIISPVKNKGIYDFILIDTNPNLSLLNFNIINASTYCIIPVQPAGFDVDGIVTVINFINGVKKFNDHLDILGIVINRYDGRNKIISEAALIELQNAYGYLLFDTIIKVDVKIQNAQWENKTVFEYPNSRIVKEYRALAKEVVKRCLL